MNSALKIMLKWGITLKCMSNSSWITTSTWRLAAILNFVNKRMFHSGETLGLFTGNKGGHKEHFLKFSALYYFFPFQNLKFLDWGVCCTFPFIFSLVSVTATLFADESQILLIYTIIFTWGNMFIFLSYDLTMITFTLCIQANKLIHMSVITDRFLYFMLRLRLSSNT